MAVFRNSYFWFVIIIISAALVRVYGLGSESIWYDEYYSWFISSSGISKIFDSVSNDYHPPLYYILLNIWLNIFEDTEFNIRLLSVLTGIFSVAAIFISLKYLYDDRSALLASLFMAFSPLAYMIDTEARMYSLLTLFAIISIFSFYALITKGSKASKIIYIISTVLMLYTHGFAFIVISIQFLFLLINFENKRVFLNLIKYPAISFLFYLPWIFVFIGQVDNLNRYFWVQNKDPIFFLRMLAEFSGSLLLSIIFIPAIIYSIINIFKSKFKKFDLRILIVLWLFVPVLLLILISNIYKPMLMTKYIAFSLPAFYAISAMAISRIKLPLRMIIAGLVTFLSVISINNKYKHLENERWRDAAHYLEEKYENDDIILFNDPSRHKYNPLNYYSNDKFKIMLIHISNTNRIKNLKHITGKVFYLETDSDKQPDKLQNNLRSELVLIKEISFPNIETKYFLRNNHENGENINLRARYERSKLKIFIFE